MISQKEYDAFVKAYEEAMSIIIVKLEALNEDFRRRFSDYPIHNIQKRIKQKDSIEKKLKRKKKEISLYAAANELTDIAGVRVICYFEQDVYSVVQLIKKQSDLIVVKETDYIQTPKNNGYKSYHLVVGVPIYHVDGMEYFPVEIQMRTLGMDFWSSMEHRICYKPEKNMNEKNVEEFRIYAKIVEDMEKRMKNCLLDNG